MKTLKQKAKAYNEVLRKAKEIVNDQNVSSVWKEWLYNCFPELTKSEDEKIRKELIRSFKSLNTIKVWNGIERTDILAWLEKQEGCEYIKKDWLEHIKQSWYKEGFIDGKYTPKEWSINDAATLNGLIDFLENGTAKLQHDLTLYANWLKTQFSPNEKQGKQNLDWSEEDKEMLEKIDTDLYLYEGKVQYGRDKEGADTIKKHREWFKIFKNKVHSKQEWNEEDENRINRLIAYFEDKEGFTAEDDIAYANWLKSFRPQNTWKPSDEQLKVLFKYAEQNNKEGSILTSLYEQLKKLKGE